MELLEITFVFIVHLLYGHKNTTKINSILFYSHPINPEKKAGEGRNPSCY
jgi:hypothetical protein